MAKPISYADAVRMLGEEPVVTALDKVFGGALLSAATMGASDALSWFDPKPDAVRLGHQLVGGLRDRITGLGRYDRTQRLQAAHAIIVITAFYEAIDEIGLPFTAKDIALSREELLRIGNAGNVPDRLIKTIFHTGVPIPEVQLSSEAALSRLRAYYGMISSRLTSFLTGLAVWSDLDETRRERASHLLLHVLSDASLSRYEALYRQLATDFPEFAFWAQLGQHRATRDELRTRLTGLHRLLTGLTPGRIPGHQLASLVRVNEAGLTRPVADTGERLEGLAFPTLDAAYIDPGFRVAAPTGDDLGAEKTWERAPVGDDLPGFLAGYLTSARATETPLVVLGQPGAGKSVLTTMMAARLGSRGFLPVRVPLRTVPADAQIQEQIERAVYIATGERLTWPDLSRSADGALPLVLLDGLDELLQTTGAQRADYLVQVAEFQRREAEVGRPVAVVVTTRTAVADRCRLPEGALAVRLEPFDDVRVGRWLAVWNEANAAHLASRGLRPLSAATAVSYGELARQPLLLLMLALYDADANALLTGDGLSTAELYERLLVRFAGREVDKRGRGLSAQERHRAVEHELLRLSITAFAMFNRGRQWVTAEELNTDLDVLMPAPREAAAGFREPLSAADRAVGGFFFVHRARAIRGRQELRTYEFLHATFGEYLIARLLHRVLGEMADREGRSSSLLGGSPPADGLLYALTSFTVLAARQRILDFFFQLAEDGDHLKATLIRTFEARQNRTDGSYERYRPVDLPAVTRSAHYSANLVLLITFLRRDQREWPVSELCGPDDDPVALWQSLALLWRSAATRQEWNSLVEKLIVRRLHPGPLRNISLSPGDGLGYSAVNVDWTFALGPEDIPAEDRYVNALELRAWAGFLCLPEADLFTHLADVFDVLLRSGTGIIGHLVHDPVGRTESLAAALMDIHLNSMDRHPATLARLYLMTVSALTRNLTYGDPANHPRLTQLMAQLERDIPRFSLDDAMEVIDALPDPQHADLPYDTPAIHAFVRCLLAFRAYFPDRAPYLRTWLESAETSLPPELALHVVVTLIEIDADPEEVSSVLKSGNPLTPQDLDAVRGADPHLHRRAQKIIKAYGEPYGLTWPE
ncbi:NACHT domain-containing protein [Planobispora rosea]|uniref:NACHT domain-containing protein n=1 Tax=Planobispora rosea TaxID=35762 RepID=UPI0016700328|nr:hypothetical protein [Planobispora rosea]